VVFEKNLDDQFKSLFREIEQPFRVQNSRAKLCKLVRQHVPPHGLALYFNY
jgi:hypothetical protein